MESGYRLVVLANIDGTNEEMFEFDYVNEERVSTNSNVSQHPIMSGDSIADHMFREPVTASFSGGFSLIGHKGTAYYGDYDRLQNIQEVFENIKNKGIRCTIMKLSRDDNKTTRFKARENMVLNSISWIQKENSMSFDFGFVEVMTAEYSEEDVIVDPTDPSLPAITDPKTLSLSQSNLLDKGSIMSSTIQVLFDLGLITQDFLQAVGSTVATGLVAGLAVGVGTLALVAGICGGVSAIFPVGTIIVAAAAVVACIAGAIWSLFNFFKKKSYKIQAFTDFQQGVLTGDMKRFLTFMDDIYKEVEALDEYCRCFTFLDDINQECMLYIDNAYYIFKLIKNTDGYYDLTITDMNETVVKSGRLTGLQSLSECNDMNTLFTTSNSAISIYMLNNALYNLSKTNASQEEIDAANKDLRNYVVFITTLKMTEFNNTIIDIIKNKIGA